MYVRPGDRSNRVIRALRNGLCLSNLLGMEGVKPCGIAARDMIALAYTIHHVTQRRTESGAARPHYPGMPRYTVRSPTRPTYIRFHTNNTTFFATWPPTPTV